MEARIARIEADVAHLRTDVADIKVDVRARFDKMDARMDRFDSHVDRLDAKLDAVKDTMVSGFAASKVETQTLRSEMHAATVALKDSIASAGIWMLVFCFTLAAGLLGTMARGFGWI